MENNLNSYQSMKNDAKALLVLAYFGALLGFFGVKAFKKTWTITIFIVGMASLVFFVLNSFKPPVVYDKNGNAWECAQPGYVDPTWDHHMPPC